MKASFSAFVYRSRVWGVHSAPYETSQVKADRLLQNRGEAVILFGDQIIGLGSLRQVAWAFYAQTLNTASLLHDRCRRDLTFKSKDKAYRFSTKTMSGMSAKHPGLIVPFAISRTQLD